MIEQEIQHNISLSQYATFGIGGIAKYFLEVKTQDALVQAIQYCKIHNITYFILGKGSNTLFDDKGFNGLVILNKIDFIEKKDSGIFYVGAGYSFSLLGVQTARWGFSGLEFASGIPGSVGGAVYMNAGANGGQISDVLVSVDCLNEDGNTFSLFSDELEFAYRFSRFQKKKETIVAATFQLNQSLEARKKQIQIVDYRSKTQPYGQKSAGCIFQNPLNLHAGKLIEELGLKGYQVGGAKVSELHANFIVNCGMATSQDVLALINEIKIQAKRKKNIDLESEVRFVPYKEDE